jgi:hypothetical protein
LQPKSRVILIREGSNLDAESLKMVAEMARERGLQIIMERVSRGDECTIIITDGAVEREVKHG